MSKTAILLVAHGTVEDVEELPEFLSNIRRGRAVPPEILAEVRRRYEAIGGRSPLASICKEVAAKLEARLGVPTRLAMRLWRPYPKDVLAELAQEGFSKVVVVPLAQHSAAVYGGAVKEAAAEIAKEKGASLEVVAADNWGRSPALTRAFAEEVRRALGLLPAEAQGKTSLLLTAHSLPAMVVRLGDPYEEEVRASAEALVKELGDAAPPHSLAFQSQGMDTGPGNRPIEWLGPDLLQSLDRIAELGHTHVVVAPIGFLADHIEILYDLDIEARAEARERGLDLSRTRSLNASEALLDAVAEVARALLEGPAAPAGST